MLKRLWLCCGVLWIVLSIGLHRSAASGSDAVLLYRYLDAERPGAFRLETIDLNGNTSLFIAIPQAGPLHISPDYRHVAFLGDDYDLYVLTATGEVILTYPLDNTSAANGREWWLWGWNSPDTVVISHRDGDIRTFYEVNITVNTILFQSMNTLNRVLAEVESPYIFNPQFSRVIAPQSWNVNDEAEVTSINVADETETTIADVFPWFVDDASMRLAYPVWSHTGDMLIIPRWDYAECARRGVGVFIYEAQSTHLTRLMCITEENGNLHSPAHFAWNATDERIAYWNLPFIPTETDTIRRLQVIDILTGEQTTLLETTQYPLEPYWSPDDAYIAYAEVVGVNNYALNIVDASSGEHIVYQEWDGHVYAIGWVIP